MRQLIFSAIVYSLSSTVSNAQQVLNEYVQEGLKTNLLVQQQRTEYEKAKWAVKEAKWKYGPTVDALGSYKRTFRKGEEITGDPSDPISVSMVQWLNSSNAANIRNGKIYYPVPDLFQGGFQLEQTVFSPELKYNRQINEAASRAAEARRNDLEVQLEADIRVAYMQFLQAYFIREATSEMLDQSQKSLDAVFSLVSIGKSSKDALYKAQANRSGFSSRLVQAENGLLKARHYFNFLLNRSSYHHIEIDSFYVFSGKKPAGFSSAIKESYKGEFKLDNINAMKDGAVAKQALLRSNKYPDVHFNAFAGLLGQRISFDDAKLPIAQVQISFKWNLFNNGTNKARYNQAVLEERSIRQQHDYIAQSMEFQERMLLNDLKAQMDSYQSVVDAYESSLFYHKAIDQKFKLGMASVLELTDAQVQLLKSSIDRVSWYYQLQLLSQEYYKQTGKVILISPES